MELQIGKWPAGIHGNLEQLKRIQSGVKLKKKIIELDPMKGRIVIQGSAADPYVATLDRCSCADFAIRNLPCKHIYCLADQLGLLDGLPVYKKKASTFDPAEDLLHYQGLFESGQISMDTFIKIGSALAKIK